MEKISVIAALVIMFSCGTEHLDPDPDPNPDVRKKELIIEKLNSNLPENVSAVHFFSESTAFAVAWKGSFYKTTDGGITWEKRKIIDEKKGLSSVHFISEEIGFAGSDNPGALLYKTADAGETWVEIDLPYHHLTTIADLLFIDQNKGFAVGRGFQFKTNDGGETWDTFELPYHIHSIIFLNDKTGFCSGYAGSIFKTTDGGETWGIKFEHTDNFINQINFVNDTLGFAGTAGNMLKTIDGGETWIPIDDSPHRVRLIHFADEKTGFAIGYGGSSGSGSWDFHMWYAVFTTVDGGTTWIMGDPVSKPFQYHNFNKTKSFGVAWFETISFTYE
jgi:photosystem II stability/assembly factor-like uncharacterized protein